MQDNNNSIVVIDNNKEKPIIDNQCVIENKVIKNMSHYNIELALNINNSIKCELAEETNLSKVDKVIIHLSS